MKVLKCKNLCLGYDGKTVAENINFEIDDGDYLFIIGENGSGKSTLIKTLAGIEKPVSGIIEKHEFIAKETGYLPQSTEIKEDFPATVREVVLSGSLGRKKLFGFYNRSDKAYARENMRKVGVSDLAKKSFKELSGGQQKRVLLARALCAARKVLILDEPAASLDEASTNELYSTLSHLNTVHGVTIITVSHDAAAAEKYATKILHLGKTQFFGTRDEYISAKGNSEAL